MIEVITFCKHCDTEIEPGEMSIENYCCDGQRAEQLEIENQKLRAAATPEPRPTKNGEPRVIDKVMSDLICRAEFGREKYGTYLQPKNGRDALMDAYQEALDLVMYLGQALMERNNE